MSLGSDAFGMKALRHSRRAFCFFLLVVPSLPFRSRHPCFRLHPTQKPLCILAPLIQSFSRPGDFVVDPFCGSGSTLLAAKLAGRPFQGVEVDANYSMQAAKRLACLAA